MKDSTKVVIVVISCIVLVGLYLTFIHRSPPNDGGMHHVGNHGDIDHHFEDDCDDSAGHHGHETVSDTWTGIKISEGNSLFQPVMKGSEIPDEACVLLSKISGLASFETDLLNHYKEWIPKIGFNNIIDCIIRKDVALTMDEDHALGSVLGDYVKDLDLPPEHIIEVVSRDVIHYAPLHGATWRLVTNSQSSKNLSISQNREEFFKFINERVCPFKNKNLGALWVACIHGVGHGLGDMMNLADAINVCAKNEDLDFGYTCASGVFMTTQDPTTSTWEPCEEMPFPALCFRFKKPLWSLFRQFKTVYPCIVDPPFPERILRACVWGHAFSQPRHKMSDLVEFCDHYKDQSNEIYLSCIDGFLHDIHIIDSSEVKYCDALATRNGRDLCHYYASLGLYFNPLEHSWYNLPLLEPN